MARTPLGSIIMAETDRVRTVLSDALTYLSGLEQVPLQEALRGLQRIDDACARMTPVPRREKRAAES